MGLARLLLALLFGLAPPAALAAGISLDPDDFPDPSQLISTDLANSAARAMGLLADHRAFEPATTLQPPVALDLSIQALLIKVPQDFVDKLAELGMDTAGFSTALPVPKFNIHKGLGERAEVGLSAIVFRGFRIIGGDFKINIAKPAEGPAWALRFNYTSTTLGFLKTRTYTPQLLISKPLDFAEPYLGIGYQHATAEISVQLDPSLPVATASGRGGGFMSFLGVGFKIPMLGVKITLEGTYSAPGAHSLGLKFGLCF